MSAQDSQQLQACHDQIGDCPAQDRIVACFDGLVAVPPEQRENYECHDDGRA